VSGGGQPLGAFDTDAAALARRIDAHARYGTRDLDPWVLERVELAEGQRVLELGCGTGKQTLPMAEAVGEGGHILAVDASEEGLGRLRSDAAERGVGGRIAPLRASFDELGREALGGPFDRVVSCFALYYVRRERPLLETLEAVMAPKGLLFFCGPSRANNAELKRFCERLGGDGEAEGPDRAIKFMERSGVDLARELFGEVEELEFENPLRFDSVEALMSYWTSYNLYDPALEDAFGEAARRHFEQHGAFETVKRVRAVRARKS